MFPKKLTMPASNSFERSAVALVSLSGPPGKPVNKGTFPLLTVVLIKLGIWVIEEP